MHCSKILTGSPCVWGKTSIAYSYSFAEKITCGSIVSSPTQHEFSDYETQEQLGFSTWDICNSTNTVLGRCALRRYAQQAFVRAEKSEKRVVNYVEEKL